MVCFAASKRDVQCLLATITALWHGKEAGRPEPMRTGKGKLGKTFRGEPIFYFPGPETDLDLREKAQVGRRPARERRTNQKNDNRAEASKMQSADGKWTN